jgi:3-phenylpropionate/cinnamic acid dioxygenase small subunit
MIHIATVIIDDTVPGWAQALSNLSRGALKDRVTRIETAHDAALNPVEQIQRLLP